MSHRNPTTVTIEKLVYGGEGLSRSEGRVLLTPFVLPGEVVEVDPVDKLRAELVRLIEPSPERVEPGCPYFGRCGGCHYQHTSYEHQLQHKVAILREVFQRVGKLTVPEEIAVISGEPWGYRNRSQFHLQQGKIGYLAAGSHELVAIDHCPISSPRLNEVLQALIGMMKEARFPRFVEQIEIFTNETAVQVNVTETERPVARHFFDWCKNAIPGYVEDALQYGAFRVSHKSFFQVNRFLIDSLIQVALGDNKGKFALDLYSGVGLFTAPMSKRFERVTAVESSRSATDDLAVNVPAAKVVKQSADEFLVTLGERPDFVLADPPRSGLTARTVDHLTRIHPERICMVSCDVATCARDLAKLVAAGYQIDTVAMADLFPQTYHMETVVHLTAR